MSVKGEGGGTPQILFFCKNFVRKGGGYPPCGQNLQSSIWCRPLGHLWTTKHWCCDQFQFSVYQLLFWNSPDRDHRRIMSGLWNKPPVSCSRTPSVNVSKDQDENKHQEQGTQSLVYFSQESSLLCIANLVRKLLDKETACDVSPVAMFHLAIILWN